MTADRPPFPAFPDDRGSHADLSRGPGEQRGGKGITLPDDNQNGDRSPDAGRYDGAFCHRPAAGEHRGVRGVVPPEDNCITCGDVAVEVRVARLLPDALAVVDTGKGEEQVSVALVTVTVGDRILVHAGEAIAVVGR
jgi:hydrogenase expression/formation protein HypC